MKKLISIIFILLLLLPIVLAQEDLPSVSILPDSALYGLKRAGENIFTLVTGILASKESKAQRHIQLGKKRLAEAKELGLRGKIADGTLQEAENEFNEAEAITINEDVSTQTFIKEKIKMTRQNAITVLTGVLGKIENIDAKEAIQKNIERLQLKRIETGKSAA